jgi:hypothetical protein
VAVPLGSVFQRPASCRPLKCLPCALLWLQLEDSCIAAHVGERAVRSALDADALSTVYGLGPGGTEMGGGSDDEEVEGEEWHPGQLSTRLGVLHCIGGANSPQYDHQHVCGWKLKMRMHCSCILLSVLHAAFQFTGKITLPLCGCS